MRDPIAPLYSAPMFPRSASLPHLLALCAPLPAVTVGVLTMDHAGVPPRTWALNLVAVAVGLLIVGVTQTARGPRTSRGWTLIAAAGVAMLLLPFASGGLDGVYRWIVFGPLRLHASAMVAPLLIAAFAATRTRSVSAAIAVVATIILALQPDAAQATSFALACCVVLTAGEPRNQPRVRVWLVLLVLSAAASFVRPDPLTSVRYVEGIFDMAVARGPAWGVTKTIAMLLLPAPLFLAWLRTRYTVALALGIYVSMTILAPLWGNFPVPVMGFGVSPIIGYFLALRLCERARLAPASGASAVRVP